ncbi:MAG: (d)CMP kinase [Coprobacillaceae bacterium]
MKKIKIAIDGPSAAGKSTLAKIIAEKLNYIYIDTGAMYRCVAYYIMENQIDMNDEDAVVNALSGIEIKMEPNHKVYLNGQDVSSAIRTNEISMSASKVSSYEAVRTFLVEQQRNMALQGGVILDGRDIGTVVLPDAELKIYQVASVETRSMRRYLENKERGIACDLETITKEIEQRDYQDSHREHSPLKQAEDAVVVDTSNLSLNEVVEEVMKLVEKVREG